MQITKRLCLVCIFLVIASACKQSDHKKFSLPSENYNYLEQAPPLKFRQNVYVPIYSEIYLFREDKQILLTATLSIRNTSVGDTLFIDKVNYYSSKGKPIKKYLNKPIYLRPMESAQFVVEHLEKEGGSGASFIVRWGALTKTTSPIIQAVMIGATSSQGISFLTEGVPVSATDSASMYD